LPASLKVGTVSHTLGCTMLEPYASGFASGLPAPAAATDTLRRRC
jgi:hypothetical protein